MSNVIVSSAKNTHYAVSTFAAIVYALVCLAASRAHAETPVAQAAMEEVVVTAQREVPEVVVWGTREASPQVAMEEVVVYGTRDGSADVRVAANATALGGMSAKTGGSWLGKARRWLQAALMN